MPHWSYVRNGKQLIRCPVGLTSIGRMYSISNYLLADNSQAALELLRLRSYLFVYLLFNFLFSISTCSDARRPIFDVSHSRIKCLVNWSVFLFPSSPLCWETYLSMIILVLASSSIKNGLRHSKNQSKLLGYLSISPCWNLEKVNTSARKSVLPVEKPPFHFCRYVHFGSR